MNKKPFIFSVGANHKTADLAIREELFLGKDAISKVLKEHLERNHLKESLVLSTCNRLELFAVADRKMEKDDILAVFADLQAAARLPKKPLSKDVFLNNVFVTTGIKSVEHIFSVTSGLDSLVVGETQITGQFKDATLSAKEQDTLGPILDRLSQEALKAAGKVRTHTDIGKKTVSISHAAIDLACRVYGDIAEHSLLVVGAGEMSRLAAKNAVKRKVKNLVVVNRTQSRALDLVSEVGFGQAFGLDHLTTALQVSDIVISSTGKKGAILDFDTIKKAQEARQFRPLFLIDIALPRDIDPRCADIDNTYLFDIDDLKQVVAEHIKERRLAAEKASGMVAESALSFMRWFDHLGLKPALSGFREYLDDLIYRESYKTFSKGHLSDLSPNQKIAIEKLLESVVGKISGDAGRGVTAPPEGFYKEQLAAALSALFPIPKSKEEL